MIREDLRDDGAQLPDWLGGGSLAQGAFDFLNTTANMAPSILASFVMNAVIPGSGAVVGATFMGASAAGNAYQEKLNLGWSKEDATKYSIAVGVSEAGLSYALSGIGALGGKLSGKTIKAIADGVEKSLGKFILTYGGKILSEGLEESLQEILNPFFENLALGYKENDFSDIEWQQVAYSGVMAMLSAGLLEFKSSYNESFKANKNAKTLGAEIRSKNKISDILEIASLFPEKSEVRELLSRYDKNGVNAENISDLQIGRLYDAVKVELKETLNSRKATAEQKESASNIQKKLFDIVVSDVKNQKAATNPNPQLQAQSDGANASLTEVERQLLNTPDAQLTPQQRAEKQSIIERLQNSGNAGIMNNNQEAGVDIDERIYNQGRMDGSNETGINTGRESQMGKSNETIDGYVQVGKAEILSGGTGEAPRRIRINHTKNSSVTFTEGNEDGTDGYKVYTAFVNAGIKAIYCQGPIERTVNGVTVTRTEAFTAPDGTVYVSSESSLPAKQTFDHEKVHVADKTNNPAYSEYEAVLCDEVDYSSDAYKKVAEEINKNYFNGKYDIEDVSTYPIFMREIVAYINQFVLSDPEFAEQTFGGMFNDWGAVVEAVNKFNNDMKADFTESANFMPENEETPSSESDRADGEIATFGGIDTDKGRHLDKAQQDEIKQYGEKLGREVIFEDFYSLDKFKGKKKIPDAYIDKDGKVHINYYAKRPVYFLLKHEITHYLKRSLKSYVDFMNMIFKSEAFEDWLSKKGHTLTSLKAEKMDTYSEVENFNEERCFDEILADFVGEYLFGGENKVSQKLINALEPKKKKTFGDIIRSIIDYFRNKFAKNKTLLTEIEQIENEFIRVYKEAIEVKTDEAVDIDEYEYINPLNVTEADISQNLIEISKMNSVSTLTGQEFAKGEKDLVTQVDDFFNEYNYSIENSLLGDVEITARGAKDSIAHGIGRKKAIAFAAVPDVIRQGKIIDYQKNWKNRGYDTIVLAAPITINNDPYYEGVIVIRDSKTQRFYVHEVITEKRTDTSFKTGSNKNVGKSGDVSSPSVISLLDKIREVKENLTFEEVDNNNTMQEDEDYSIPSSTISYLQ